MIKNIRSIVFIALLAIPVITFGQTENQPPPPPPYGGQQTPKTPEERAKRQTQWMRKNLAINEEQAHKVYDIILRFAQQSNDVRTMPKGPDKRYDRKELIAQRDNELRNVLTPVQFQGFRQHEEEMKRRMQERRNNY